MVEDVFISYHPLDKAFVTQLHQELHSRGILAWFDQAGVEAADHWPTAIAEGIRGCKVFVAVLSPEAVQSTDVRKQVDLAEKHNKKIVPLMWRQTEIPVALEYALAGVQLIDFKETASLENFNELSEVLIRLIGGASMAEAIGDIQTAVQPTIPALPKEQPAPATERPKLKLGGKRTKVNPLVIGGLVISNVVTTFGLDTEEQDFLNEELKWLFSAADHMIKVQSNEVDINQSVPVSIPPQAKVSPEANNKLFPAYNSRRLVNGLVDHFKNIDRILRNLGSLLDREVDLGEQAKKDLELQTEIRKGRLRIVEILTQVAQLMNQAYGIKVTTPDQLLELLEES